jgi:hypothetical protein
MIYYAQSDLDAFNALPASERDPGIQAVFAFADELKRKGELVVANGLEPGTATIVRKRGGKLSVTDGPFIETKEQLTGFYLIEARDLNDAIRIAGGLAEVSSGTIEVRPVREHWNQDEGRG